MRTASFLFCLVILLALFPPFASADGGFEAKGIQIGLDTLISRIMNDHSEIERARYRIEKEEALFRSAKGSLLPQVTVDTLAGSEFIPGEKSGFFGEAGLRFSLFEGGRHIHEKKKQALKVEESKFLKLEDEMETIYQIKALYLNTLRQAELLKLAQEWVRETGQHYRILRILRDKDLVLEAELLRGASQFEESQLKLIQHKEAYDYGLSLLCELLKMTPNERLMLEPVGETYNREFSENAYIEQLRKSHPMYQILPLKVSELESEKKILFSERLPEISFVSRFQSSRVDFDQNRYELGLQGSWNIWDWGVTSNQIKAKAAEINELKTENKMKLKQLEEEVKKKMSDYKIEKMNLNYLKTYLKEIKKKYEGEKTKFLAGRNSSFDVIESFIQLKKAQMEWIDGLFDMKITLAQIETIGGFRQ